MFATEEEMSNKFERYLKTTFGNTYLKECSGLFGIPDFVLYTTESEELSIISFELKLTDWKRAVKQAFRYKSFSNIAYVVLPSCRANAAVNNLEFFEKYNIGLAKFNMDKHMEIVYKPTARKPYSDALRQKLVKSISGSRKKSKDVSLLV